MAIKEIIITTVSLLIVLKVMQTIAFKSPKNCGESGLSEGKVNQRIVGGTEAKANEFPFMASLQKNGRHFCGGSILNKRWILTAAHCLHKTYKPEYMRVYVGINNINDTNSKVYRVDKTIVHGCFAKAMEDLGLNIPVADIGLIKTEKDIDLNNRNIGTICLPQQNSRPISTNIWTAGWGVWNETRSTQEEETSDWLQKMKATIMPEEWCVWHSYFLNDGFFGWREDNRLCLQKSGSSSCRGDSGGPAFQLMGDKVYQLGITSFGGSMLLWKMDNTCYKSSPGVWENVAKYVDWISQVIDEYKDSIDVQILSKCTKH